MTEPRTKIDRRMLVLGGLLAATGGAAIARQPQSNIARVDKDQLGRLVPTTVGSWSASGSDGLVLPPADALSDSLYSGLVTRNYVAAGQLPIMLLVAYSNLQDGMLQVHRPETCYKVGGFDLTPPQSVDLPTSAGGSFVANAFTANGISRVEQVLYWTRIGDAFPRRWIDQRIAVLRANLRGNIPDGVLVRISTLNGTLADALPSLQGFAAALLKAAPPAGRKILDGA